MNNWDLVSNFVYDTVSGMSSGQGFIEEFN